MVTAFVTPRLIFLMETYKKSTFLRSYIRSWQEGMKSPNKTTSGKHKLQSQIQPTEKTSGLKIIGALVLLQQHTETTSTSPTVQILICREVLWWYHATVRQGFWTEGIWRAKYSQQLVLTFGGKTCSTSNLCYGQNDSLAIPITEKNQKSHSHISQCCYQCCNGHNSRPEPIF